ncbi:MAG: acetyl-coenzyme A synthetase, partial [Zetaproteobacteria bacterium CG23_combo_of_CG06-09_8_20_14_all_54_7]
MPKTIDSTLQENRTFDPPAGHTGNIPSLAAYHALRGRFSEDFDGTWRELAREHLLWQKPFSRVLNREQAPFYRWFEEGKLNLSENCLDRHVDAGLGERMAIIWEGEAGVVRRISYADLLADVCRAANAMRELGIASGDRVVIYMPMIPEAAIAMLACTRIGAIHSVVFGAFSPQALRDRI